MRKNTFRKLLTILSVFFMSVSIFVNYNNTKAEANTYEVEVLGSAINDNGYWLYLTNYDEETFNSVSATIFDGQDKIKTETYDSYNEIKDTSVYGDGYKLSFFKSLNFTDSKIYKITINIESNYKNKYYVDPDVGNVIWNACLERLVITKYWNDNDNASGKRPTAQ